MPSISFEDILNNRFKEEEKLEIQIKGLKETFLNHHKSTRKELKAIQHSQESASLKLLKEDNEYLSLRAENVKLKHQVGLMATQIFSLEVEQERIALYTRRDC